MPKTVTLTIDRDHIDPDFGFVIAVLGSEMEMNDLRALQDTLNAYKITLVPVGTQVSISV